MTHIWLDSVAPIIQYCYATRSLLELKNHKTKFMRDFTQLHHLEAYSRF